MKYQRDVPRAEGDQGMKRSRSARRQEGMVLIHVTLVMVLSMLLIPPILGFVGGAGRTAQIREDRMHQVYAADTGVEDALYRVMVDPTGLPESPEDDPIVISIEDVNGCDVTAELRKDGYDPVYKDTLYTITSTAQDYRGIDVSIESRVAAWDYSSLLQYGLVSTQDIEISSGADVDGNLVLNGELANKGTIDGNVTYGVPQWPDSAVLSLFYSEQVSGSCGASPIEVKAGKEKKLGPCQTSGDLDIGGVGNVSLQGTLYVAGDLRFNPSPSLIIRLNGETIYGEGSLAMGSGGTLEGPGCIIAEGEMYFSPNTPGSDYILVMSVAGDLTAQPGGSFFGTLAGCTDLDLQPNASVTWVDHPADLNFPGGDDIVPKLVSYVIRN
jgi:hypothetical protein